MAIAIDIVPCLKDNYAYLLHEPTSGLTAVVDPSESVPILERLQKQGRKLDFILNTHHHWDHTGGNLELKKLTGCKVIGPEYDRARIPGIDTGLTEGEQFMLGASAATVLYTPGHTNGQVNFFFAQDEALFTGDTLFSMGCGRLFEGSAAVMWQSLARLRTLPGTTRIYCGHEYTLANSTFALAIEPNNAALPRRCKDIADLRQKNLPTVPVTMAIELATNPFLRPDSPEIRKNLNLHNATDTEVFAELRLRKDRF